MSIAPPLRAPTGDCRNPVEMKITLKRAQARVMIAVLVVAAGVLRAQPSDAYRQLRYDEDYSFLRDPANARADLEPLKFIPLSPIGNAWLTLGGEVRARYEYIHNSLWGQGPQDRDGFFLLRTMVHADWHCSEWVRVFAQLKSGLESGREGGPRPTDRDDLDLNQAFVDLRSVLTSGSATLRFGRQELVFGSSRIISAREGPNVRLSFDGVHGIIQSADRRIDVFAVEPAETNPGVFDDRTDSRQKLWGVYAVMPWPSVPDGHLDLYYLGLRRADAHFDQGTAREKRESLGARIWGHRSGWDYNFEFVYQFGRFGDAPISAWTAASDTGFTFSRFRFEPRLGLKADIASGDRDPRDSRLETFNALFPRGGYFNDSAIIGPANFIDLHPSVELKPVIATSTGDRASATGSTAPRSMSSGAVARSMLATSGANRLSAASGKVPVIGQ
jgi:hypothetical protein